MDLKQIIGVAASLATAVEAQNYVTARVHAARIVRLASAAELQQVATAAPDVVSALDDPSLGSIDLGHAIIVLADELALVVRP